MRPIVESAATTSASRVTVSLAMTAKFHDRIANQMTM